MLGLTPGLYIENRFRLDHLVGEGGMGCVWAAFDKESATFVALKFPKLPAPVGSGRRTRFCAEAEVTVPHENVVRILGTGCLNEETPFIVMELLHGVTLRHELRRAGRLSLEATCTVLGSVLSALAHAHAQGIVHRDIKPENIFLSTDEDMKTNVKILDFGVAKQASTDLDDAGRPVEGGRTEVPTSLGTLGYASPEQILGHGVDFRADVWALGVVLHECVTGKRPFPSDSRDRYLASCSGADSSGTGPDIGPEPASMRWERAAELPDDIQALLNRALSADPWQRPLLHEMREVLGKYGDQSALPVIERPAKPSPEEDEAATISTAPEREPLHSQDVARVQPAADAPRLTAIDGAGEAGSTARRRRRAALFVRGGAVLGAAAAMLLGTWVAEPEKSANPAAVQEPLDEARIFKQSNCKDEIEFELDDLPTKFHYAKKLKIKVVIDDRFSAAFEASMSNGTRDCSRVSDVENPLDAKCTFSSSSSSIIIINALLPSTAPPHDKYIATVYVTDNHDQTKRAQMTVKHIDETKPYASANEFLFRPKPPVASSGCTSYGAKVEVGFY